ncbi:MAG TPA: 3'(2'),5'-bisphosphate nucleotidase CysQ [Microvirga sp.]|jgi:3'(2'), 5'-bisphosphate nucleotidase|nr:3'(2'),5'-bisphosphate nucleotidase CysQ [Microvirga sp.]
MGTKRRSTEADCGQSNGALKRPFAMGGEADAVMTPDQQQADAISEDLAQIALKAGRLLQMLQAAAGNHRIKSDGSPTTQADLAAEHLIIEALGEMWPGIPVIAEETSNAEQPDKFFFLVDPLDGTRDYISGTGEYSVNIALVQGDRPIASVVSAPALGRIWIAGQTAREGNIPDQGGSIAWKSVRVRPAPGDDLIALMSRRHGDTATEACLATLSIGTRRMASSSVKFCLIASGEADVYVRCGPTMEWDTAAGDHILSSAGGCVIGVGGTVLTYGHEDRGYRNGAFAALGDSALAPQLSLRLS